MACLRPEGVAYVVVFDYPGECVRAAGAVQPDPTPQCSSVAASRHAVAQLSDHALPAAGGWVAGSGISGDPVSGPSRLLLQVDGTPGSRQRGIAGLGIVVRNASGHVLTWRCLQAPARTSNEAEYQAVIAGLRLVLHSYPGLPVRCLSDSRIVVEQITGQSAVRAATLRPLHTQAMDLVRQFDQLTFRFLPRELNRLADALAWEALGGVHGMLAFLRQAA